MCPLKPVRKVPRGTKSTAKINQQHRYVGRRNARDTGCLCNSPWPVSIEFDSAFHSHRKIREDGPDGVISYGFKFKIVK